MGKESMWSRENDVTFFAWMDFCLESDLHFRRTAPAVLKRRTGVSFTEDQITNRCHYLVRESKNRGYDLTSSEFSKGGTSSIRYLEREMRDDIRALLEDFREREGGEGKRTKTKDGRKHAERPRVTLLDGDDSQLPPELEYPRSNSLKETSSRPSPSMMSVEIPARATVDRTPRSGLEHEITAISSNTKDSLSLEDMRKMHKEMVSRMKAETAAIRTQWQHEVEDHIQDAKRRRQITADLQAENTHLKTAQQERQKARRDPLEEVLFRKDQEIWLLKQANHKMRTLATFAGRTEPERQPLAENEIEDGIDAIENELQAILHGHDPSAPLLQPEFGVEGDLASLLRNMFQDDLTDSESSGHLLKKTAKWGAVNAIRGLAVAALNQWVFTTDFPNFCDGRTPRLLKAYRNAVFIHDGWTCLHNLELAAYSSLIDSSEFRKITIPRRANELASRLSKALAPLFPRSTDAESNANFESWNEEEDVCEDRRYRMKELFEAALRLKAAAVMTDETYEFVVHPPGSSITEAGAYSAPDQAIQDDSGYWLQASLYTYAGEPSEPADHLADAIVHTNNFISNRHNKEERKRCLAEKHLKISKSGDASMDALGDSGQDLIDVDATDRWAYTDEEPPTQNEARTKKRPYKQHDQKHSNKRHKAQHQMEKTPDTADSDYDERKFSPPKKYKQRESGGTSGQPSCCPRCGGTYNNHGSLLNHIRNQTCVFCEPCNEWFKNSNLYKAHVKEEHTDAIGNIKGGFKNIVGSLNKARKPGWSWAVSDDSGEGEASEAGDSDSGKPSCEFCGKSFTTANLRRHVRTMVCQEHKDAKPDEYIALTKEREDREKINAELSDAQGYKCKYCGKTFSHIGSLPRHLKDMICQEHRDAKPDLAKALNKQAREVRENTELSEVLDSPDIKCEYCGEIFTHDIGLQNHLHNMSCQEYRDAEPDIFEELNEERKNIAASKRPRRRPRKSVCEYCHKGFSDSHGLRRHLVNMSCSEHHDAQPELAKALHEKRVNNEMSDGRRLCATCGRNFSPSNYSRHLKRGCNGNPCTDCDQVFITATALRHHTLKEHDRVLEPPLSCSDCGLEFSLKDSLRKHMYKKPCRKCDICGEWFSCKKTFSLHQKECNTGHETRDTPRRNSEKGGQNRNFDRRSSGSSLSALSQSDLDELSAPPRRLSGSASKRLAKLEDVSDGEIAERPPSHRRLSARSVSAKQEQSRSNKLASPEQLVSPAKVVADSFDYSESLSQSEPVHVRQRVFNSPSPQESPQRAREVVDTQHFNEDPSQDEPSNSDLQTQQDGAMEGKHRRNTEVQNSSMEDEFDDFTREHPRDRKPFSKPEIKTEQVMFKNKVSFKLKPEHPSNLHRPSPNDSEEESGRDSEPQTRRKSSSKSVFLGRKGGGEM